MAVDKNLFKNGRLETDINYWLENVRNSLKDKSLNPNERAYLVRLNLCLTTLKLSIETIIG